MMSSTLKCATMALVGVALGACAMLYSSAVRAQENDPDVPRFAKPTNTVFVKEEFMARRAEGAARKRGLHPDKPVNPILRQDAIAVMETQQRDVALRTAASGQIELTAAWQEIGPNPIPNGQVVSGPSTAASGRTIAIAVHPTNPNIVYVGTAQGGLYRSTNGGTTWTAMMDNALSMAIGTIAIAPTQPDTIFVGTGEPQFSIDSFFGVGIYRIDNASTASPTIVGPFGGAEFAGRAVSKIAPHPTDANIFFASSATGLGGISGALPAVAPNRGLFRTTNALSAAPTFTRLTGLNANANTSVRDFVIDPLNPNLLVANVVTGGGLGGIYVSNDALSVAPAFIQRVVFNSAATSLLTAEFAIHHTAGPNPTIYAATGNPANGSTTVANGRVLRSTDSGVTWTTQITNGFCGGQCFYDIAIAVDPTNANTVYLGGSPNLVFGRSLDAGLSFTANAATASGLHADTHAIAVAPSLPSTIYFGSDGGIYKSTNSGTNWTPLNNATFKATQFMSIAVHPIDPNFTIGGTQDNGTNFFEPAGTWRRADFGDGGYAVIDQSAVNTTAVNMYHTYFNNASLQGYGFVSSTASASEGNWTFRGCSGNVAGNGIPCGGAVLFYAPLEQGPGTPNTLYYGANILYRSSDRGLNHTVASQNLTTPISAIGISRQDDNVRIVGLADGGLFGTTTGSATLTNIDSGGVIPAVFIARAVIDPNNVNIAYVTLSAYAMANVWRTANLSNANPTWTAITGTGGNVLPQIPVSAFIVDPANSANLYAGTDIGVYVSTDSGANWTPFGTGLPRVAVFDMAKTSGGLIRIATHGRGLWQIAAVGTVPIPFVAATTATLVSESFAPANGVIDPGETVTVALGIKNTGSGDTINDVGTLQASGGVTSPGGAQNYGVLVAGGASVSRNFTFTAAPALTCGNNITATVGHVDGATNLGNVTYTFGTGSPGVATTTSYTGVAVPIPDNTPAGVNVVLPVSGVVGGISDVNFRLDALAGCNTSAGNTNASVTHSFMGDLAFKLTSPAGTTVNLITSRGNAGANFCGILLDDDNGFPPASSIPTTGGVVGNFAPESPLSAFDGQNANGNWTLNVADLGALDTGTFNRFSLIIAGTTCAASGPPPDLTITKTHAGNFAQGQIGATYSVTVTNSGAGDKVAGALVTVTDTPPAGLTITAMSGIGWTCATLPTCTRSDVLGASVSYSSLTITANVAGNAASPLINGITVSTTAFESNTANNTATDSAVVIASPDLTVNKSHVGNFALGQIGAKYTVVVTNSGAGDKAAGSLVTLVDTPPSGLTITAISGAGWTCATLISCTRSDALASGVSYAPITVTVNVAAAATSPQVNAVSVATAATESNAVNNLGTDTTLIVTGTAGSLTVNKNGSGTGSVTSVDGGINCGATCTFGYVNGSNIVLTATPVAGSVFTGWLGPCTGTGACTVPINGAANVSATFALATTGTRVLDIDANAAYAPESDGALILRYVLGVRGSALTDGALGAGALRTGDPQMSAYLLDILPLLDVDGNGRVDAMTDGVMIVRKLLGLNGSVITAGVLGAGATRSPAEIDAYIQTLKPP